MDYNTLEKLGKAVLYGNILASIHTPAQTKVQFDTALEMYKKYVGNVYNDTLPAPADVDAVEGDRCLLNVDNDYEAYEVVGGVWKKYTTKEGATTEADLTDYYTKPEVREYINNLIKDFIPKNGDNTFSGSNTFTKLIIGDLSGNADTATKATKDSEGNVIKDTYATKTECSSKATLDATQMLAVNSGITASKVAEYEAMKTSKVNEADIKTVAKTGSYNDLINKPTINDSTINIKVNGVSIGTFTTNNASAKDIAITVPTKMSDLDNDSDYVASTTLHDYAKLTEVENKISDLVSSAPETLDTLNELANALGNDSNFATTVATQIGTKANDSDVVHKSGDETIGGTKTFNYPIKYSGLKAINDNAYCMLCGGSDWDKGATITLYGKDYTVDGNNGVVDICARSDRGVNFVDLTPDVGLLPNTFNSQGISLGSSTRKWTSLYANSIFGGANNIDCSVDSQGAGWIRYSNGLQICLSQDAGYSGDIKNLPASFASAGSYAIIIQQANGGDMCIESKTSTSYTIRCTTGGIIYYILAVGYWK